MNPKAGLAAIGLAIAAHFGAAGDSIGKLTAKANAINGPSPGASLSGSIQQQAASVQAQLQAVSASPAMADSESNEEKRKTRYRKTEHIKEFYRVNRYPNAK